MTLENSLFSKFGKILKTDRFAISFYLRSALKLSTISLFPPSSFTSLPSSSQIHSQACVFSNLPAAVKIKQTAVFELQFWILIINVSLFMIFMTNYDFN
jgi:hypothetical protein